MSTHPVQDAHTHLTQGPEQTDEEQPWLFGENARGNVPWFCRVCLGWDWIRLHKVVLFLAARPSKLRRVLRCPTLPPPPCQPGPHQSTLPALPQEVFVLVPPRAQAHRVLPSLVGAQHPQSCLRGQRAHVLIPPEVWGKESREGTGPSHPAVVPQTQLKPILRWDRSLCLNKPSVTLSRVPQHFRQAPIIYLFTSLIFFLTLSSLKSHFHATRGLVCPFHSVSRYLVGAHWIVIELKSQWVHG